MRGTGNKSNRKRIFQVEKAAKTKGKVWLEPRKCWAKGPLRGHTW